MPEKQAARFTGLSETAAAILGDLPVTPTLSSAQAPAPHRPRLIAFSPDQITTISPIQTRAPFDPENNPKDEEFARSVLEHGVILPVLVYQIENPSGPAPAYGLISGHRRLAAARHAHLDTLPALLVPAQATAQERDLLTALENLQRKDLSPVEKARQIRLLMDVYAYTQVEVAAWIGLSQPYVSELLGLLSIPASAQAAVERGALSIRGALQIGHLPDETRAKVFALAEEGLDLTTAIEEIATLAPVHTASQETHPEENHPSAALEKVPAPPKADPQRAPTSAIGRLLGPQKTDVFQQALREYPLTGPLTEGQTLVLAAIWLDQGEQDLKRALSIYQGLTKSAKVELAKALQAIDRLALLYTHFNYPGAGNAIALYLEKAIQVLLAG